MKIDKRQTIFGAGTEVKTVADEFGKRLLEFLQSFIKEHKLSATYAAQILSQVFAYALSAIVGEYCKACKRKIYALVLDGMREIFIRDRLKTKLADCGDKSFQEGFVVEVDSMKFSGKLYAYWDFSEASEKHHLTLFNVGLDTPAATALAKELGAVEITKYIGSEIRFWRISQDATKKAIDSGVGFTVAECVREFAERRIASNELMSNLMQKE